MSSMKIVAVSLLPLLVAACSNDKTPTSAPAAAAPQRVDTSGAVRVAGDLAPTQLVKIQLPAPTERALLSGADPLPPRAVVALEHKPEIATTRDFHRTVNSAGSPMLTFPLDTMEGARVIVRALNPTTSLTTVHLRNIATGARLDIARDPSTPVGQQHPLEVSGAQKGGVTVPSVPRATSGSAGARPTPMMSNPGNPFNREPGFAPLTLATRILSIDVATKPGMVALEVPADVAAAGITFDVEQPSSHITLSGAASELAYSYGETAALTFTLAEDGAPIDGAKLVGSVTLPNRSPVQDLTFTALGGGQYSVKMPLTRTELEAIGAWGVHVVATGTSNGLAFERDLDTAFGYFPAHARMLTVTSPQVLRAADGLVDEVRVDVDVETLVADRLSLRGTLTYTGSDGAEHPLAAAQTGQVIDAGHGTISLRFSADAMALAKVDGPFHVRDLALVSNAFSITQHRLGRGLDLLTPALAAREIRYPKVLSVQAQELLESGEL